MTSLASLNRKVKSFAHTKLKFYLRQCYKLYRSFVIYGVTDMVCVYCVCDQICEDLFVVSYKKYTLCSAINFEKSVNDSYGSAES